MTDEERINELRQALRFVLVCLYESEDEVGGLNEIFSKYEFDELSKYIRSVGNIESEEFFKRALTL